MPKHDEAFLSSLAAEGELDRYQRRREKQAKAVAEGRPRDPFIVDLTAEGLLVTPLDGDLEFERKEVGEELIGYLQTLLQSAGLADAARIDVVGNQLHLVAPRNIDKIEEMLAQRVTVEIHLERPKTLLDELNELSGVDVHSDAVRMNPDPYITHDHILSVRGSVSNGGIGANIKLDEVGTELLATATQSYGVLVYLVVDGVAVSVATASQPIEDGEAFIPVRGHDGDVEELIAKMRLSAKDDGLSRASSTADQ